MICKQHCEDLDFNFSHDVTPFLIDHHLCFAENSLNRNKDGKRQLEKRSKRRQNELRVNAEKLERSHQIWGIF